MESDHRQDGSVPDPEPAHDENAPQRKPWVTPDHQELDHEMTAGVPGGFGDGYHVGE